MGVQEDAKSRTLNTTDPGDSCELSRGVADR